MKKTCSLHYSLLLPIFCFASFFGTAHVTLAAPTDPMCSLYIIHNGAVSETKSNLKIQVIENDFIGLIWNGTNVTTGVNKEGKSVSPLGAEIITPTRDQSYSYTFSNGSQNVTCSVDIAIISGEVNNKSTVKSNEKFIVTGRVEGTEKAQIVFYAPGAVTPTYTTKPLSIKNEKYNFKMPKALADDTYRIDLQTTDSKPIVLATSSIMVGKAKPVAQANIVVQTVPLLMGGTVKVGSGVAVAYLQVINIGDTPAQISSFTFAQAGSAPTTAIVGVTMTDELGLSKGSVGNMTSESPFVGSRVTVPLAATLAAKESRLFTVRAVVANSALPNVGQTMSLSLQAVTGTVRVQSALPLNSVTWTIGR